MYDNYIFDLYGTLVDIRTNENKASLWKYMAGYLTLQGAHNCGLSCMYIHTVQSPEIAGELPEGCIRLKDISDVLLQN